MKKNTLYTILLTFVLGWGATSCNDFLDSEPLSKISPEQYFTDASHLQAYADKLYSDILPSHGKGMGLFSDAGTDNQVARSAEDRYGTGYWRVPNEDDDNWNFSRIYKINFFFDQVLPKFGENLDGTQNTITGTLEDIQHYIGEMYFLRSSEYFKAYQKFGDFPIITRPLNDNKEELVEANKRSPRNEVARFILSDLDKAAALLEHKMMKTTRINKDVALLLKSRVALFEGTWLKYFKGSAFVPQGTNWPGASKEYNANYQYPLGNIDEEITWFLEQAMKASYEVAEKYKGKLTQNTGRLQQDANEPINPYYEMFAQEDLSAVPEVLLWRQYSQALSGHNTCLNAAMANASIGVTRGFVQNFLMNDGRPVYAHTSSYAEAGGDYKGDQNIADVRTNRDNRLTLFLMEPNQKNVLYFEYTQTSGGWEVEPLPQILNNDGLRHATTGYLFRKGASFHNSMRVDSKNSTACPSYRATEALLNYMEASYEHTGILDASAREYWMLLRQRAYINGPLENTINNTIMEKEAENDWAAYSGGKLIDATLYNIRRERRCEFLSEGLRYMDLCRWRSMDQWLTKKYLVEGFHLWNTPMENYYIDAQTGKSELVADRSDKANVSPQSISEYLCPFEISNEQKGAGGLVWHKAHYLYPLPIDQFQLTAPDNQTISDSPLYQNPYWPAVPDEGAEQ